MAKDQCDESFTDTWASRGRMQGVDAEWMQHRVHMGRSKRGVAAGQQGEEEQRRGGTCLSRAWWRGSRFHTRGVGPWEQQAREKECVRTNVSGMVGKAAWREGCQQRHLGNRRGEGDARQCGGWEGGDVVISTRHQRGSGTITRLGFLSDRYCFALSDLWTAEVTAPTQSVSGRHSHGRGRTLAGMHACAGRREMQQQNVQRLGA